VSAATPLPPQPPRIISTSPAQGQEHPLKEPIRITFDQPMDRPSLKIAFSISPTVEGGLMWEDNTLLFTPAEPFERDTEYRVTISQQAQSAAGLTLAEPFSFAFRTVGYLEVTQVQPTDGTNEVGLDTVIMVMFNRPVVPLKSLADQTGLPQPLIFLPPVTGQGEWLNTSIYTFKPDDGFQPATTYKVRVRAGLTDTTGGLLPEDYTWTFTTIMPDIVRTDPESGARYVAPTQPITVTFNQPMDHASVQEHFLVESQTKQPVTGKFRWSRSDVEGEEHYEVMVFQPDQPLALGGRYSARVTQGAKSALGEGVTQRDRSWYFNVIQYPAIVRTDPSDGSRNVDPWGGMEIIFSSPMNPDAVMPYVTIVPTVTNVYTYWNDLDTRLWLNFERLPSTAYTVTFGAGMEGKYGHKVKEETVVRFTTRALDPAVWLEAPGRVGVYNAYTNTLLYVTCRNVSELTYELYRLDEETFVRLNGQRSWDYWETFKPRADDLIHRWSRPITATLNQQITVDSNVTDAEGNRLPPGLYYLLVRAPEIKRSTEYARQLLAVTRLNLTLKASRTEALVWTTDLKTGEPVSGVPIRVRDEERDLATGTVTADGLIVEYPPRENMWQPLFVFADLDEEGRFGDNFAVAITEWSEGISPWDFNLNSQWYQDPYSVYLYTDRPIYRPGQKVYFKGILRADDDAHYSLPAGVITVPVAISDAQGKELYHEVLTVSDVGTFHGELQLGEEAGLGYYQIAAQLGGEYAPAINFQVAEYRKPEFQVDVETDKDACVQGDTINVAAQATYYFGGPVADAYVRWSLLSANYFFNYKGKGYWDFTDYEWWEWRYQEGYGAYGELISQGEGRTDKEGRFTFSVPAEIAEKTLSQLFTIEVSVTDVNNQEVSNRTAVVVHKGLFYIGLRPQRYVSTAGEEATAEIITVNWDSEPVPGVPLTIIFNEHRWYSVREKGEDGRFYWTSKVEDIPVYTTTVTTDAKGMATASFVPEKGGTYKVLAIGKDERGNEVRSATYLWVSSHEFVSWRMEDTDRIDLIADKKEYTPGETAKILVPSPYQGPVWALITVERGHIMYHEVRQLQTNSDIIEIPIKSDYTPNVFVSVTLIKGVDKSNPLPSFKMGYVNLPVSVVEKVLQVTITPDKEKYSPRQTATYEIQATDYTGKPVQAELSLSLVDLSVLALGGAAQTSLVDHFYSERGVGVQSATSLVMAMDRISVRAALRAKGGGGGVEAAPLIVRTRFPDTAYWNPAVRTDEKGRARVQIELPDTLTTWRLGSKAITADTEVAETNVDVVSTLDLLIRPVAPRFFIINDQAELAAVVHNNTDADVEVDVKLEAQGLAVERSLRRITVPAHGKYKVSWPIIVQPVEQAVVRWTAQEVNPLDPTRPLFDAVELTLPVYHFSTPEVVATAGQLEEPGSRLELVQLPERLDPSQGELTIRVSPSLAAGMRDGLQYLEHYPYECTEQTVSRFFPNVVSYAALKKLGIKNPELEARLPQMVGVGLQRLYANQHYDGGWGWWVNDKSEPYLTAYVLHALIEADRAGFAVDEAVMRRAAVYLLSTLSRVRYDAAYKFNRQAYILYVLAEYGEGDLSRAVKLYDDYRESLSNYGKAYLALTFHLLDPKEQTRVKSLIAELTNAAVLSATGAHWEEKTVDYWTMNTNSRSTSIVLRTLARLDPKNPLLPNVVRWLMVTRKEGHWETTQETVWAIMALTDYMVATGELEADYSYRVTLNDETALEDTVTRENVDEEKQFQVAVANLLREEANRVLLSILPPEADQTGKGRLYYTLDLRYFLPVEDVKALNRGIIVARQYSPVNAPKTYVDEARVNEAIRVKLTIIAPHDLHYLVVEDPLPAGCEGIDTSLKTTSVVGQPPELERTTRGDYWDWGWGWWWFSHSEIRDEKVVLFATFLPRGTYEYTYLMRASVPGEFNVKPSLAYEMYFPEVFGRSDGAKFVVTGE